MGPTTILIKNLRVETVIGVYAHEKSGPQALRLDLELHLDGGRAARSDALSDTVDYDEVCTRIRRFGREERHDLLERFVHRLAGELMRAFPLRSLTLTAWKHIEAWLPAEIAVRVDVDRAGFERARWDDGQYDD